MRSTKQTSLDGLTATPRDPEVLDRRQEIIRVAADLFSRRGYHRTTVRDVASALGMNSGSLYSYIQSKEDLLYEISVLDNQIFYEKVAPIAEGGGDVLGRIRNCMVAHFELTADYGQQARLALNEFWLIESPERLSHVRDLRDQYDRLWQNLLEEGVRVGEFRSDIDVRVARLTLLSFANWTYVWLRGDGPMSVENIVDEFMSTFARGVAAEGRSTWVQGTTQ